MAEYNKAQLTEMIVGKLLRNFGRTVDEATPNHMFKACAMVLRDIMSGHQIETSNHVWEAQGRQVHYLSLEFLMGRSLEKNGKSRPIFPLGGCAILQEKEGGP